MDIDPLDMMLIIASQRGSLADAKALVAQGANIQADNGSALQWAKFNEDHAMIDYFYSVYNQNARMNKLKKFRTVSTVSNS